MILYATMRSNVVAALKGTAQQRKKSALRKSHMGVGLLMVILSVELKYSVV